MFAVGGVPYPAQTVPARDSLPILRGLVDGRTAAPLQLLAAAYTPAGLAALLRAEPTDQQLAQILDRATDAVLGPTEQEDPMDTTTADTATATDNTIEPADPGFAPIRLDTTVPSTRPAPARVPLFYIDGVEYTTVGKLSAADTLRILNTLALHGEAAAVGLTLELSLGEDGHRALLNCQTITDQQMRDIIQEVRRRYLAQLRVILGN